MHLQHCWQHLPPVTTQQGEKEGTESGHQQRITMTECDQHFHQSGQYPDAPSSSQRPPQHTPENNRPEEPPAIGEFTRHLRHEITTPDRGAGGENKSGGTRSTQESCRDRPTQQRPHHIGAKRQQNCRQHGNEFESDGQAEPLGQVDTQYEGHREIITKCREPHEHFRHPPRHLAACQPLPEYVRVENMRCGVTASRPGRQNPEVQPGMVRYPQGNPGRQQPAGVTDKG